MKAFALCFITALGLATPAAFAEQSAKITDVHLCCKGCANGVEKAVGEVPGAYERGGGRVRDRAVALG